MAATPPFQLKVIILVLSVSLLIASQLFCTKKWSMIAAGGEVTLGLMTNGSIYIWGRNTYAQVPVKPDRDYSQRSPYLLLPHETFRSIASKFYSCFAITTDGRLYAWGKNGNGQLGIGSTDRLYSPVQIGKDSDWKMIAPGDTHTLALKEDGSLYAWGEGRYGQLGNDDTKDSLKPVQIMPDTKWTTISAGESMSFAIRDDGALFSWGRNYHGALGDNSTTDRSTPVRIGGSKTYLMVAAGDAHAIAIDTDGTYSAWGDNGWYQLGMPQEEGENSTTYGWKSLVPVTPESMRDWKWKAVSADQLWSLALREDGSLWAFGDNFDGQLGDPNRDSRTRTTSPFNVLPGQTWKNISAGQWHGYGVTSDNFIIGWGDNYNGAVGGENGWAAHEIAKPCISTGADSTGLLSKGLKWIVKKIKDQA